MKRSYTFQVEDVFIQTPGPNAGKKYADVAKK